ncbi:MAG: acetylglutamate kinase [Nitrospinota bacterium]
MNLTPGDKTNVLVQALPYIRRFHGKTVVVKYGGAAMEKAELRESFAEDVTLLSYIGIRTIIVHGGGPQIGEVLKRQGKETRFVMGLRVTDPETMDIVSMVLGGKVNKDIVGWINGHGGRAVGLSGVDAGTLQARKLHIEPPEGWEGDPPDLGRVGEVHEVRPELMELLAANGFIPVVAPMGVGEDGRPYNINADTAAGHIAGALRAEKLVYLTDVPGIQDEGGGLLTSLDRAEVQAMQSRGDISGGMLPKVDACLRALESGVRKAHVIDGRVPHSILLEVFTDRGIGTEIVLER